MWTKLLSAGVIPVLIVVMVVQAGDDLNWTEKIVALLFGAGFALFGLLVLSHNAALADKAALSSKCSNQLS